MSTTHAPAARSPAPVDDLALFHRTLAGMCRSGVPLPRAFAIVEADLRGGRARDAVRALAKDVDAGVPLADAYRKRKDVFPPLYGALVEAGIASGDLPAVLEEIARHAARRAAVAARFRSALSYPLLTAVVVLIGGLLLLAFAAPGLERLAGGIDDLSRQGASASLVQMVGLRLTIVTGALVALLAAVLALVGFAMLRRPLDEGLGGGAFALRIPVLGRLRLYAGLAGLSGTLAALVHRSVPLPRALDLAVATVPTPLRAAVARMRDEADEGSGLANSLRAGEVYPPSLLWLVDAGEQQSAAGGALEEIAEIYEARLGRACDRASAIVGPAAELVVGVVVFLLAYTFVLPLIEFSSQMLGKW